MTESDQELAEAMLEAALAAGAEAVDALVQSGTAMSVGVADGALEEAERSEGRDLGLRVLIGHRQACVSISDTSRQAIAEMADRVVAMARAAPEDPSCGLAEPAMLGGSVDVDALELSDPAAFPDALAMETSARAAEAAALAVPGVSKVEQASMSWHRDRVTIVQSNGFSGSYERSTIGVGVSAIAGEGLAMERDHAVEYRRYRDDLPEVESVGRLAGERAAARLQPRKPVSGQWPVIYDERVAGGLIGHVLSAVNGVAVARGASWLRDAMETEILPPGFDVVEDPLIRRGRGSRPFDAEGIVARRRTIVEKGVLKSWVLDLSTARKLGLRTTGNARRGPSAPPTPGVTNIRVTEGQLTRDALIAEMGTGLIVTSLIGASINPTTGDYSRGAAGFWVEGGEIVYPVNEITVAGSLPEMMRTIVPANDADPNKAMSVPSVLVGGLAVGA